jgi:peptide/nickel transport system ATP-binding protein
VGGDADDRADARHDLGGTLSAPPLLEVEGATKTFSVASLFAGRRTIAALGDASFRLEGGKALALVGESGSGKTTCALAIAGLLPLTSGRILFRGADIAAIRGRRARFAYAGAVQMIFQDPFATLNPTHTVRHHIARPLKLHGRAGRNPEAEIRRALGDVELDPDATIGKYPHELSGGERQRVNLARALAVGADLIIADEPTSMLDVSIRRSVLDLMRRLKQERGISFLYITHDIATGRYLAEDTAVMFAGRIVEHGLSDEVVLHPRHPYSQLLLSAAPRPGRRMAGNDAGREFTARAEAVRALSRQSRGPLVEYRPGHFVLET